MRPLYQTLYGINIRSPIHSSFDRLKKGSPGRDRGGLNGNYFLSSFPERVFVQPAGKVSGKGTTIVDQVPWRENSITKVTLSVCQRCTRIAGPKSCSLALLARQMGILLLPCLAGYFAASAY